MVGSVRDIILTNMADEWYYGGKMDDALKRAKQAGKAATTLAKAVGKTAVTAASSASRTAADAVNKSIHEVRVSRNNAKCQKAIEQMTRDPTKSSIDKMGSACGTNVGADDCARITHAAEVTDGMEVKKWWGGVKDAGAHIRGTVPYKACSKM